MPHTMRRDDPSASRTCSFSWPRRSDLREGGLVPAGRQPDRLDAVGAAALVYERKSGDRTRRNRERYAVYFPLIRALIAARSTAAPPRYTAEIFRVFLMSSSGLASSTTKSALLPAATVPASSSRRNSAEFFVAATMTSDGVIPAATMSAIST